MMPLDLGFRRFVIRVWAVETHASCSPGIVNVGTQHIPALAQMQHPVMPPCCPTLWCDSNPFFLGHMAHSCRVSHGPVARPQPPTAQSHPAVTQTLAEVAAFVTDDRPSCKRRSAHHCLLYTSDAADDLLCVDLGGRRII